MQVPPERPEAPAATAAVAPPTVLASPAPAAFPSPAPPVAAATGWRARLGQPKSLVGTPPPELTWILASAALAASVGWIYERRQRVRLDSMRDSGSWPSVKQPPRLARSRQKVVPVLTDRSEPAASVRSIYPSGISQTTSRREATLIDLHELRETLQLLRELHDITGATELLEQHIVDFRYTSPWVFMELREQYKLLDQQREWDLAREVFRNRFGQNAPQWSATSTADDEIANDGQLCQELLRKWPRREARMFILRWMLGDAQSRQKNSGPPRLTLGIYRDMMLLDSMLDEAMQARPAATATA